MKNILELDKNYIIRNHLVSHSAHTVSVLLERISTISMEKSMDWQSIRAFTWPTTRSRTAWWSYSH